MQAETVDCDLVVIGGGPCGSTAATLARQAGLSVVLVERDAFPRFHIGESLLPAGNVFLRRSGVWPKVESAGFIRKAGARFCSADASADKRIEFGRGFVRGLDSTFQVSRAKFDHILLEHARSEGVVIKQGWKANRLVQTSEDVTAWLVSGVGGQETIRARWCQVSPTSAYP